MRLTDKQEEFCRRYVELRDEVAAARAAGYVDPGTAGSRNMKRAWVQQRIAYLLVAAGGLDDELLRQWPVREWVAEWLAEDDGAALAMVSDSAVAEPEEILEFLTGVMRGTVSLRREDKPKVSERTRAAELLGRNQRLFGEKGVRQEQQACVVRIWGEEELE